MAKGTIIEFGADLVSRVASGVLRATGRVPDSWFGPLNPLTPVAQETQGRQFDFQTGLNIQTRPRQGEAISFQTMRTLADVYDLLRLVIETRKDQIEKLEWIVRMKEDDKKPDDRCKALTEFFAMPDREHDWPQWLRMMMEDMLVLDAATIYPRRSRKGEMYGLELVDGATIKRVIDPTGRTPAPPMPAYQQILKGIPASSFTYEELLYRPRNPRTNKLYGFSPVEQVIVTINLALSRQASQISYYTHGSAPNLLISVPKEWTSKQIMEFKQWWDSLLAGNIEQRSGTQFVPDGVKPVDTKEMILKDQFDEWLARIVCYAFSVSPQPFIKEMNRATAETNHSAAMAEGLQPVMQWVKGTVNAAIVKWWGYTDITFDWVQDDKTGPKEKADIHCAYVDRKIVTPNEVREELGREPLTPEQQEEAWPTPEIEPGTDGLEDEDADPKAEKQPAEKLEKKKRVRKINRNRKLIATVEKALTGVLTVQLAKTKRSVKRQLLALIGQKEAADLGPKQRASEILEQLDLTGLAILRGKAEKLLKQVTKDGAAVALAQIGVEDDRKIVALANKRAEEYARDRAAELVGMRWVGDDLVPNPSASYRIDSATREMLRGLVENAIAEGSSNDDLAAAIEDATAFSPERAEVIARTETAAADVNGNMGAYRSSGLVVGKQWILAQDEYCDDCAANEAQGVIGLDEVFSTGDDAPPAHPNCRCDVVPVLDEETEE